MFNILHKKFAGRFTSSSIEKNLSTKIVTIVIATAFAFMVIFIVEITIRMNISESLQENGEDELTETIKTRIELSDQKTAANLAEAFAKQIEIRLNAIEYELKMISNSIANDYPNADRTQTIKYYLDYIDPYEDSNERHFVELEDGSFISKTISSDDQTDHRDSPWYQCAKSGQHFCISDYHSMPNSVDKKVITFSYPILSGNTFVGVAGINMDLAYAADAILSPESDTIYASMLISNDGGFLMSRSDASEDVDTLIENDADDIKNLIDISKQNGTDNGMTSFANGKLGLMNAALVHSSNSNWSVLLLLQFDDMDEDIKVLTQSVKDISANILLSDTTIYIATLGIMLLATIIILILAFANSKRSAKRLTDPIVEIVGKIKASTEGDLNQNYSKIKTGDEIEQIAQSIGQMMQSFRELLRQIETATTERERASAELNVAKTIQTNMLPNVFPAFPNRNGLSLHASMTPAQEVGGDFYDYFFIDERNIALIIGDVSGKGVSAALFMSIAKTIIHNIALTEPNPSKILQRANIELNRNNEAMMFATCFLAIINVESGESRYANAGHNFPLIYRKSGEIEYIGDEKSYPLAIFEDTEYPMGAFSLNQDDRLVLYTDGVTESFSPEHEEYGNVMLEKFFNSRDSCSISLVNLNSSLLRDVLKYSHGKQFDDITILMFSLCDENSDESITVQAEQQSLADVQKFVRRNLKNDGVKSRVRQDFELIIEEVFKNIVDYAYPEKADSKLVRIEYNDSSLTFIDSGVAYDPTAQEDPDVKSPAAQRDVGGLGIYLTREFSDSIDYKRVGEANVLKVGINAKNKKLKK